MENNGFDLDMPIPRDHRGTGDKYNFGQMPIGASFALPKRNNRVLASATAYKRRHPGWGYTSRTLVENGKLVIRIWRTS